MLEPLREDTSVPSLSRCPLPEEALLQLSARDPVMRSYVAENRRKGADPQWTTGGHGDALLARHRGRQAKWAAGLTDDLIREVPPEQRR